MVIAPATYTGDGNRDLDFHGKTITVRSTDPDDPNVVAATIIDCEGTEVDRHRGFKFHSGETSESVLAGLTITNGYPADETILSNIYCAGGAVLCIRSSPTIANCALSANVAKSESYHARGGGISCFGLSSPTITDCTVTDNYGGYGGGIALVDGASATIHGCTFTGNVGRGAAIQCAGTSPTITECVIRGNATTSYGGGVECYNGNSTISKCTIAGNSAKGGGAMYFDRDGARITNCLITGNWVEEEGGGVRCADHSSLTITNCIIAGNSARTGGGIFCELECSLVITNCTVKGNSVAVRQGRGGGVFCDWRSSVAITNCILWGDAAEDGSELALGGSSSTATVSYSDIQGGQTAVYLEEGCTLNWG